MSDDAGTRSTRAIFRMVTARGVDTPRSHCETLSPPAIPTRRASSC